jgi:hypothetical protein
MYKILKLQPISNHLYLKINILRGMMYCGILWGLYNAEQQGWAMTSDHDDYVFPFGSMVYTHTNMLNCTGQTIFLKKSRHKISKAHYCLLCHA